MTTYPLVVYPERSRRALNLFALAFPATKKDFRSSRVAKIQRYKL